MLVSVFGCARYALTVEVKVRIFNEQLIKSYKTKEYTIEEVERIFKKLEELNVNSFKERKAHVKNVKRTVKNAEKKMAENQIRRIPVVDNNKVVGILTLGDLAKYSQKTGQENFSNTFEEICDCGHKNNR